MRCSPGRERRQPPGLLLRGAGHQQRQRGQLVDREDQAGRRARPAELLDREADREEVRVQTAECLRKRQRQDVLGGEQLAQVLGKLARPIDLRRAGRDALVGQRADRVTEERLLLRQPVGGRRRLGHRRHRSSGAGRRRTGRRRCVGALTRMPGGRWPHGQAGRDPPSVSQLHPTPKAS